MNRTLVFLAVIATICITEIAAKPGKLPSKWKVCKKNDPELQTCFKEAVAGAVMDLVDGEQSLGVLPVDPMRLTRLSIDQGAGPVAIDLQFQDLDLIGIGNAVFNQAHFDPKTYDMSADVEITQPLYLIGNYVIKGRVLVLPITGSGRCNLTLESPTLKLKQKGSIVKRGGESYLDVTDFAFHIDTKKLHIFLENLFNGNKELGDTMNVFLNQNSAEVLKELKPAISDGFGQVFKQISNRVFSKVPIDRIFPEK